MAPEESELIGQLILRAGMIMEDRAGEFISRLPADKSVIAARIELLRKTGEQLVALAAAAATILENPVE